MTDRTWTIIDVIQWTTGYFKEKSIDSPRAAAELLLAHVLGLKRIQLYLNYDKPLAPAELAKYRALIKRRVAGEPVQYITGVQEFWSLPIRVSPATLIPRPETELLVEESIRILKNLDGPRILEIGAGSGAISIALATELKSPFIAATDISQHTLAVAKENRDNLNVTEDIHLVCGSLLDPIIAKPCFHLIVSNPPYVSESEYRELPREIREHEPAAALLGGKEGLDIIRKIIGQAHECLLEGGVLLLEIGATQGASVVEFSRGLGVYDTISLLRDYSGKERVLKAEKKRA